MQCCCWNCNTECCSCIINIYCFFFFILQFTYIKLFVENCVSHVCWLLFNEHIIFTWKFCIHIFVLLNWMHTKCVSPSFFKIHCMHKWDNLKRKPIDFNFNTTQKLRRKKKNCSERITLNSTNNFRIIIRVITLKDDDGK